MRRLQQAINAHPLTALLIIAFVLRLIAVFFAKGYQAVDDHFMTVRPAIDWVNGLPTWFENTESLPKRGVLYQYYLFAQFWTCKQLGVTDFSVLMYINRFIHALWSLTLIPMAYYGIKRYADEKAAFLGALLIAVHFVNPFMSVRNMVGVICQPFLLGGLLSMEVALADNKRKFSLLSGILMGLAFSARHYVVFCTATVWIFLLIKRRWNHLFLYSVGAVILLLINGIVDYFSWGYFLSSIFFTMSSGSKLFTPPVSPFYTYILLILAALIPPFSVIFGGWILKSMKKLPLTFWAVMVFFIFHSIVPAKQERFILPIFPALIMLGMIGWHYSKLKDKIWVKRFWTAMWIVNFLLLPVGLFNYSQKGRIEPLIYLSKTPGTEQVVVVSPHKRTWLPYSYQNTITDESFYVFEDNDYAKLKDMVENKKFKDNKKVTHVILLTHKDPEIFLEKIQESVGKVDLAKHIGPSVADWLLHKMNPKGNNTKESYVYRVRDVQ